MQPTNNRYRTADLYYAAYLSVAGVPLMDCVLVKEGRDKRVFFLFEQVAGLKDLKREYFNRKGKVSALQYADEVRSMKNQTHEVMASDAT